MKILNCMFGKKLGGLEQAFLDYNQALLLQYNNVLSVIHPKSAINRAGLQRFETISNFSNFDFFAVIKLRKLIAAENPQCIVTHGKRATILMRKAAINVPIIAVSHKSRFDYLSEVDGIIAITKLMEKELLKHKWAVNKVHYVPNMIAIPSKMQFEKPIFYKPPVIGMMARFTPEKGHLSFIKALKMLKDNGLRFKAKIAGDGTKRIKIEALTRELGLMQDVELLGWVTDKNAFYQSVDMICVPSEIETFGLVILEAFMYSKPCIASKCSGPLEIGTDGENILLYDINNHEQLANLIQQLIEQPKLAKKIAQGGFNRVQDYLMQNVSKDLQRVIESICSK